MSNTVALYGFGGGGGGCLNFKVVGGTAQPTNPKENTIWVNTSEKITDWAFSATEPEKPAPGMVWFAIDTFSPAAFNALKKNGIQVYPIFAKQYVDGAWVDVTAKSYRGGEWVEWVLVFFEPGKGLRTELRTVTQANSTINITNDKIVLNYSTASSSYCVLETQDKISLNGFSYIKAEVKSTKEISATGRLRFYVATAQQKVGGTYVDLVAYQEVPVESNNQNISIPISSVPNDLYYVGVKGAVCAEIYDWKIV